MLLTLRRVSHHYAQHQIVQDVSFSLAQGEIGCLLGLSGCGKTTLLRCIAGFEPLSGGEIFLSGQCVSSTKQQIEPQERHIGVVFQDYALLPHLTVRENIGLGLYQHSKTIQHQRVTELLILVGLQSYAEAYPHALSGGQQQRVALARALAPNPKLLLLDEPFSNLDVTLRERLGQEVRAILKAANTSALLVTHDQHEAFAIADKIGVMADGNVIQWDSAPCLYHHPNSRFVADFIGEGEFLPVRRLDNNTLDTPLGKLHGDFNRLTGTEFELLVRPHALRSDDPHSPYHANIEEIRFRGHESLYHLRLQRGERLTTLLPSNSRWQIGDSLPIRLELSHYCLFPCTGEER